MSERRRRPAERGAAATGLARAASSDPMTFRGLVDAVGGVLGIVESIVPSLVFVVVFQITGDLVPSVVAPLVLSALFVAWRLTRRQRVLSAVAGAVGAALSAVLALVTGNANDNFVPGLITNAVYGLVFLVSVLVRSPILGVAVSFLLNDQGTWRADQGKRRLYTWLTLLWVALFAIRLVVELPLYLAGNQVVALGIAHIVLGLPLYAPVLVLTVLAIQAVYRQRPAPPAV